MSCRDGRCCRQCRLGRQGRSTIRAVARATRCASRPPRRRRATAREGDTGHWCAIPRTTKSRRAWRARASAPARVGACTISLARSGSKSGVMTSPCRTPLSTRMPGPCGSMIAQDGAGLRQESLRRRLRIQSALDGMPARGNRLLQQGQRQAVRHVELQLHQVQPGHQFGDGMLHLEPRVHLEEVEGRRRHRRRRAGTPPCPRCDSPPRAPPRRPRRRVAPATPATRPATAPPRSPSGAAAAASTRVRRDAASCRARRR